MQTQSENKRAVVYCRVSTKEQVEEGNSLITQEKYCREYALKNEYEIAHVFIEQGESAKTADRTELQKLFRFCANRKNAVAVVIAYKIDRISRNTDDYSQIRILLKRYGVEIKSTSEYFEDNPAGRFMENIIANVAQFDNDVRTERSVGGMLQAVREGRYVWNAPTGYTNGKINGKSNIIKNELATLIKQAFKEVVAGIYSINEVRLRIAKSGLCQKNGNPLSKSHFYHLLNNELYAGQINMFGEKNKGAYESIISEELFNRVQRIIRSKKISRTYIIENPDFPLRRFVTGINNEKLTGYWAQGRKKKYPYYRFLQQKMDFKKDFLEEGFAAFLSTYALPANRFDFITNRIRNLMLQNSEKIKVAYDNLAPRQKALKEKKQLLLEKNLSGVISDAILKEQLDLIEDELWKIQSLLENKDKSNTTAQFVLEELSDFFISPGDFWKRQPFDIKKKLQRFEFPKGVVFDGKGFRTTEICSIFKLNDLFPTKEFWNVHSSGPYLKHTDLAKCPPVDIKDFNTIWPQVEKELIELRHIIKGEEKEDLPNTQIVPFLTQIA